MQKSIKGKLLFISHDANRSGAPILLLTFLIWLKRETETSFEILLLRDGPLRPDFESLGHTFLSDETNARRSILSRASSKLRWRPDSYWIERSVTRLKKNRYAAVYGNSIVSLNWLIEFRRQGQAVCICHVHEMAWAIGRFHQPDHVREHLPQMNAVIACSNAVAEELTSQFQVAPEKLGVAWSFIGADPVIEESRESVRSRLGLCSAEFVIGGVGTPELRKGTDLLVRLAAILAADARLSAFRLIWLGGQASSELVSILRRDAVRLEVEDRVLFVEHTSRPDDFIGAFDALIVPSREEPLSLVAVAAACLCKPIVCFARSGGITELLEDECGYIVPYLDLEAMAAALISIRIDPGDAAQRALNARTKSLAAFTADNVCPKVYELIVRTLETDANETLL